MRLIYLNLLWLILPKRVLHRTSNDINAIPELLKLKGKRLKVAWNST